MQATIKLSPKEVREALSRDCAARFPTFKVKSIAVSYDDSAEIVLTEKSDVTDAQDVEAAGAQ